METEKTPKEKVKKSDKTEQKKKTIPQSKYFCGIIDNVNGQKEFTKDQIKNSFAFYPKPNHYFFILHDKDENDMGEMKMRHYHFVCELSSKQTKQGFIDSLKKSLSAASGIDVPENVITASFCSSTTGAKRYLVHKDENHESGEKYPYPESDIITNDISSFQNALNGIEKGFLTYEQLFAVCNSSQYKSDVFKKIGIDNAQKYLGLINCIFDEKRKRAEDDFIRSRNSIIATIKKLDS
jgi:hypothetical protein